MDPDSADSPPRYRRSRRGRGRFQLCCSCQRLEADRTAVGEGFSCASPSLSTFQFHFISLKVFLPSVLLILLHRYVEFERGNGIAYDDIWTRLEPFEEDEKPLFQQRQNRQGAHLLRFSPPTLLLLSSSALLSPNAELTVLPLLPPNFAPSLQQLKRKLSDSTRQTQPLMTPSAPPRPHFDS
jgi:hypothetical protein